MYWIVISYILTYPISGEEIEVIDTKVDIAFMFDEHSPYVSDVKRMWDEVVWTTWLDQYLKNDGAEENTRFAFIPCVGFNSGGDADLLWNSPYLYFDGKLLYRDTSRMDERPFKTWKARLGKVVDLFWNPYSLSPKSATSNVVGCARSVLRDIFDTDKGDRKDAPNIVFCKYLVLIFQLLFT